MLTDVKHECVQVQHSLTPPKQVTIPSRQHQRSLFLVFFCPVCMFTFLLPFCITLSCFRHLSHAQSLLTFLSLALLASLVFRYIGARHYVLFITTSRLCPELNGAHRVFYLPQWWNELPANRSVTAHFPAVACRRVSSDRTLTNTNPTPPQG